jgi:hypothetical protein
MPVARLEAVFSIGQRHNERAIGGGTDHCSETREAADRNLRASQRMMVRVAYNSFDNSSCQLGQ